MALHNQLGKNGEQLAVDYLLEKGYRILARNFCYLKGEIDIIALEKKMLCVVEVKSRTSDRIMLPQEAITKKKIQLLVNTANAFLEQRQLTYEIRFDIITVLYNAKTSKIDHLKNAFYYF